MGDRHGSLSGETHAGYRTLTEHHRKKARNPFGLCSEKQCRSPTARCQGPKRGDFAPRRIPAPKCRFRFPGDPEMRTPDARGSITPASRCGPRDARSWKPATDGPSRPQRRIRPHQPGRSSNGVRPELKSRRPIDPGSTEIRCGGRAWHLSFARSWRRADTARGPCGSQTTASNAITHHRRICGRSVEQSNRLEINSAGSAACTGRDRRRGTSRRSAGVPHEVRSSAPTRASPGRA